MTINPIDGWIFVFHFFVSVAIPWQFMDKVRPIYLYAWTLFLLSSCITSTFPLYNFHMTTNQQVINDIKYNSLVAWFLLTSLPVAVIHWRTYVHYFYSFMFYFFCVDSLFMLTDLGKTGTDFGLINGNTYDCALMALFLPFMGRRGLIFIPIILYYQAKTAIVLLAIQALWWLHKKSSIFFSIALLGAITSAGLFLKHYPQILYMSGRVEAWDKYIQWWLIKGNLWYGNGLGSFAAIAQWIPVAENNGAPLGLSIAHNDYLQILWDTGLVGLITFIGVILCTYKLLKGRDRLGAICFSVMMLVYFPLHTIPSQILAVILILGANDE